MSLKPVFALLGKRDEPTDAVEEYCRYLGRALESHDVRLGIHRVSWEKLGWSQALEQLRQSVTDWRDQWVIVQYTALAWSARGFPHRVLRVMKILESVNARPAIVFHDVEPFPGSRLIDHLRHTVQLSTMRRALALAELAIFTVPPSRLSWLKDAPENAVFIPVGANLPPSSERHQGSRLRGIPTIGVFSITGGDAGVRETREILAAIRFASLRIGNLRLSVFGRHAEWRKADLLEGLRGLPVEFSLEGVVEAHQVVDKLYDCDVLLFVRGAISTRRGSAIAGISCGLPIIAYSGSETAPPITEAGVVLVSQGSEQELGLALVRVLTDAQYRESLALRSRNAQERYFSWAQIAQRYAEALGMTTRQ